MRTKNKQIPLVNEDEDSIPDEESLEDVNFKSSKELEKEAEENMKEFSQLLDGLSSLHAKKVALWKQIYENAVMDRRNSYLMWSDLYKRVHGKVQEHMVHGMTLSKYMERLNKANEQIIKLAEILNGAIDEDVNEMTSEDSLYDKLENNK